MSISVVWDDADQTIICMGMSGRCTWSDIESALDERKRLLESVCHCVYTIADFSHGNIHPSVFDLPRAYRAVSDSPLNAGIAIIVGSSRVMRAMYRVFTSAYPGIERQYPIEFRDTLEAARAYIMQLPSASP
jgi:hypothetical protein